ncbi:hypothetical protein QYM36_004513, partial [Artemia franciscana]
MNKSTVVCICICIFLVISAVIVSIVIPVKFYRHVTDPYGNCIRVNNLSEFVQCPDLKNCYPIIQEGITEKSTIVAGSSYRAQDLSFYLNCEAIYYCETGLLCKSNRNDLEDSFRSRSTTIIIDRPGYSPIRPMFHNYHTGGLYEWNAGKFAKKVVKTGALVGGGALLGHMLTKKKYKGLDYSSKKNSQSSIFNRQEGKSNVAKDNQWKPGKSNKVNNIGWKPEISNVAKGNQWKPGKFNKVNDIGWKKSVEGDVEYAVSPKGIKNNKVSEISQGQYWLEDYDLTERTTGPSIANRFESQQQMMAYRTTQQQQWCPQMIQHSPAQNSSIMEQQAQIAPTRINSQMPSQSQFSQTHMTQITWPSLPDYCARMLAKQQQSMMANMRNAAIRP